MIRLIVLLLCAFSLHAETVAARRVAVQIDAAGNTIPPNSIATPAQVSGIEDRASAARSVAEQAQETAAECAAKIALYSTNYVVTSTVYVQSVGAVAYDPSNQTIRVQSFSVTATNVQLLATVKQLPLVAPSLDWRVTLGSSGASWSNVAASAVSADIPAGATDAAAAYLFTVPRPSGGSAFFRVVDNSTGASGSGLYWVVFGGIYVDGHKGATQSLTNIVGAVTNIYRTVGGVVVEPDPMGGF